MTTAISTAARDLIEEHGLQRNRFLAAYVEVHLLGAEIIASQPPVTAAELPAPRPVPGPGGRHKADRRKPASTVVSRPALRTPAPRPVHAPSWTGNALAGSALPG